MRDEGEGMNESRQISCFIPHPFALIPFVSPIHPC
jgi:hypothetical protein